MQGTQVQFPVWEESTGCEATKLVPTTMEPELWGPPAAATEAPEPPSPRAPQQEKPPQ